LIDLIGFFDAMSKWKLLKSLCKDEDCNDNSQLCIKASPIPLLSKNELGENVYRFKRQRGLYVFFIDLL